MRVRAAIALATTAFAIAVVVYARGHWDGLYDDAFIYLRYTRNLDNGCGLRFNCHGAAVEGFTSPLFLGLLWLGSLVTKQLIDLCQVLDVVFLIAAGGLAIATAAALATDEKRPWAPIVVAFATCAVLACDDFVLLNANTGLETSLAAAALALVGFAAVTERPRLLVVAVVVAALARPESSLLVLALPIWPAMRKVRRLAPVVGALIVVEILRLVAFGSVLPNTYYAKAGGTWRHVELGAAYVVDCLRDFPLSFFAPVALVIAAKRRVVAIVLVVAGTTLVFFLRVGGDTFYYSRLWFPFVPVLTAFALGGAANAFTHPRGWLAAPVLAALVATRAWFAHDIPDQGAVDRIQDWVAAGTYLREHYPRGTLVATVPIGAIGYYSSLPILDLVGLTEPTVARLGNTVPGELLTKRWIAHERFNTAYVLLRAPKVIVTTMIQERPWTLASARAGFWADWLLLQEIRQGHAPYEVVSAEIEPHRYLLMFERK